VLPLEFLGFVLHAKDSSLFELGVSLKKFEGPDFPMIISRSPPPPSTQGVRILTLDKDKVEVKVLVLFSGIASFCERKQGVSIDRA
jgi:hypothetical protein